MARALGYSFTCESMRMCGCLFFVTPWDNEQRYRPEIRYTHSPRPYLRRFFLLKIALRLIVIYWESQMLQFDMSQGILSENAIFSHKTLKNELTRDQNWAKSLFAGVFILREAIALVWYVTRYTLGNYHFLATKGSKMSSQGTKIEPNRYLLEYLYWGKQML